jgi:signal transduction histidine kinase
MQSDRQAQVLIVDDNPAKLLSIETTLAGSGYDLVTVGSGREALRYLLTHDVAVLLLDVNMPEMDGFETAALIRKRHCSAHTPIIFVSAISPAETYAARGYRLGAVDYIFTPIVPEILRAKVAVFVDLFTMTQEVRYQADLLRQLNGELARASRAKDTFLAAMSHELRTPLNSIIGFTGTLLMGIGGPLSDEQQEQLGHVQASANHLLSLINDVLDLTKIEAGKVDLIYEPVACAEVVAEVAAILRPLAEAKALALEVVTPSQECTIQTDRRALSQILMNLTSNAIKFTRQGQVRIEMHPRQIGERAPVSIDVVDTGIGIQPDDQRQLFQPFSQIRAASARQSEGTGLGLYLSQKLATLLGGAIEVASEAGRGSTFTLALPDHDTRNAEV